ncbi:MAG: pyrroline-5-carboxylate reductase [Deltaproteobacteria bacterium]|nr:pyrroline-5-carboxylate reductase [Deltaproteobacteria bacterium]MBW1906586.1 pyrroline-5-carboxylate reductase [Deltaproteobacteria bacterium]MBW2161677.1 pyrroline-5-carboxylate reductase [Deltaproteobacteria bacterium]MBW2586032.1 pyrroline-5-carboxylate reductase [Deltaproteobacteria bacterium]
MSVEHTIVFVGAGNMAGALIRGLIGTGTVPADRIIAADPDQDRLRALEAELEIRVTSDNAEAVKDATVVVLAIKPQVFAQVLPGLSAAVPPHALLISIAAGISTRMIERSFPDGSRVVRTMPNTPALVGAGASAIAGGTHATDDDLELAETLFRSVGISVRVPEEQIDAVTGLSGSGPAYVFAMIEALRDAGAREGLPEETALQLAAQTVFGAARLLLDEKEAPEVLRDRVTSPGGTTRAGLDALAAAGFADAIMGAVRAATRRSVELGKIAEETEY